MIERERTPLERLKDAYIAAPADGQVLTYHAATRTRRNAVGVDFQLLYTDELDVTSVWTTAVTALFSSGSRTVQVGDLVKIHFRTRVIHGAVAGFQEFAGYQSAGTATLLNISSAGTAVAVTSPGTAISRDNSAALGVWVNSGIYVMYVSVAGTVTLSFTGTTGGSNATTSSTALRIEWWRPL